MICAQGASGAPPSKFAQRNFGVGQVRTEPPLIAVQDHNNPRKGEHMRILRYRASRSSFRPFRSPRMGRGVRLRPHRVRTPRSRISAGFRSHAPAFKPFRISRAATTPRFRMPRIRRPGSSRIGGASVGRSFTTGRRYRTTGLAVRTRSLFAKSAFLKSRGYSKVPTGYQVDHVTPLFKGGLDTPSNMQLLPTFVHRHKTAWERRGSGFSGWVKRLFRK